MRFWRKVRGIKRNRPDRSYSGRSAVLLTYPAVQSGAWQETARPVPNAVRFRFVSGMGLDSNHLPHDFFGENHHWEQWATKELPIGKDNFYSINRQVMLGLPIWVSNLQKISTSFQNKGITNT
jgi:hypothetical protein